MEENIMELWETTRDFISSYKERDFEKIWNFLHPEDQKIAKEFGKKDSVENFVFQQLDQRFEKLPENTAISSRVRRNEHGVDYVLIFDEKHSGLYTEPTQLYAIPLPIKESDSGYKIKLYDNKLD
ncbi:hypothetical protein BL313_11635 [Staphylococcus hominis]|nr:hypothetical protein BL313_11635 [Staphylococcus hominis]